jgi:hypothetical protein
MEGAVKNNFSYWIFKAGKGQPSDLRLFNAPVCCEILGNKLQWASRTHYYNLLMPQTRRLIDLLLHLIRWPSEEQRRNGQL